MENLVEIEDTYSPLQTAKMLIVVLCVLCTYLYAVQEDVSINEQPYPFSRFSELYPSIAIFLSNMAAL